MNIEIIEKSIRFHLHGISGVVENERYGEVGLSLMNEMWQVVKGAKISTTSINHWVYLPGNRMFVQEEVDEEPEPPPLTIVRRTERIGRNDPCPCGSGKKFKKCCYGKNQAGEETDPYHAAAMSGSVPGKSPAKYPIGTVALYGPNEEITTKIVAGVIKREGADPILERWMGTNIQDSPKVKRQMQEFFRLHGVKSVVATDRNMGCAHEEGQDFPHGEDCPFCPFWKGKQGSNQKE